MSKNTTPALPVWIQELDLETIGRRGGHAIQVHVHGYWSDPITIYVRRKEQWDFSKDRKEPLPVIWEFELTHSSGGRTTDEVAEDIDAEANFAQGILAAVQHARLLRSQTELLEKHYQAQQLIDEVRRNEAKRAADEAKAARVAADTVLGSEGACRLVAAARDATTRRVSHTIYAYPLGEEESEAISVRAGKDAVVRFTLGGQVISAANLTAKLVGYSARSHVLAVA